MKQAFNMMITDTKSKILNAAIQEFAEHGFSGATIRGICKRADVNVAAVNYHFDSKETLYLNVFKVLFERKNGNNALYLGTVSDPADWEKSFRSWIRKSIELFVSPVGMDEYMFKIMFREMSSQSLMFENIFKEYLKPRFEGLEKFLRLRLPPEITNDELYIFIFSIISQFLFYSQSRSLICNAFPEYEKLKNKVDDITDFITEGVMLRLNSWEKLSVR